MAKQDETQARLDKITKLLGLATSLQAQLAAVLEEMDDLAGGGVGIGAKLKTVERAFDTVWCQRYARGETGRYMWRRTTDVPHMKRLIKALGLDEVVLRVARYLASEDPFLLKQRHPFGLFVSGVNSYASTGAHVEDYALDAPTVTDCKHTPRCTSDQQHTQRKLQELRGVSRQVVDVEERTLPHNLEAERSVLGSILVDNGAWLVAAACISGHDFFRGSHRLIWNAMATLIEQKSIIDFVTVKEELERVGDLDDVGGPVFVAGLADGMPRATNTEYYARIVKEKALLREIIFTASRAMSSAYHAEDHPDDILRTADRAFLELQRRKTASRMRSLGDSSRDIFARLEWRAEHKGQLVGVETGFPSINEMTLGWRKKDYVVIAARPSIGKTVFAMNSGVAAAQTGERVAVFSYEMRRDQLEDRILSSLTGIPFYRIEAGTLGAADYPKIANALEVMGTLPLYIDDRAGQYVSDVRNTCRRMQSETGLGLVIIDYVQLIPSDTARRGASRNEQITEISRSLKELADELDVPILVLSQLKRIDPRRGDPRPQLDDLRESGSLEQDADEVNFLHRRNHKESGTTNFIREKARNGPTGTRNLTIDRDTVTFTDGGEDPPEEPEKARRTGKRRPAPDPSPELPLPPDDAD